jgi:hypothetical protein
MVLALGGDFNETYPEKPFRMVRIPLDLADSAKEARRLGVPPKQSKVLIEGLSHANNNSKHSRAPGNQPSQGVLRGSALCNTLL